ncbi:MAG: hypothetical protein HYZ22_19665 [Chloroflexi bacterium]|nr:hypothetical protein [Chloroflexota bacterium]
MKWLADFSATYANAISAFAALGALFLTLGTLWYLKSEFSAKYRPYVKPIVNIEEIYGKKGFSFYVLIKNVGPHPCYCKLSKINLRIGDENYSTPDLANWILTAPQDVVDSVPVGNINKLGLSRIRKGSYRESRIEISFVISSKSIDHRFNETTRFVFEIDVLGKKPIAVFRPEWITPGK